jgi:hypothetical protein
MRIDIIKQNLRRYFSVSTHTDKKMITEEIVDEVTRLGRFLRYDKDHEHWLVMDRENARIKVAQALQYRQRRVAKGLESMDDSPEPNPLPPSHQGGQAGQQHISQRIPATAASLVVYSRDVLLGLSQGSVGSQQHQQKHGGWGSIHRHQQQQGCVLSQPSLPSPQQQLLQQQQQPHSSFDYNDDTSIGFAAVQQQERDRQTLSHQFDDILSGRLQNLPNPSAGQLHLGPLYNVAAARPESYAARLGHLGVADQHSHAGILHAAAASQEQTLMALALEPRPLPFRSVNDVMATGVPNSFSTSSSSHTTSTAAAQGIADVSFRPIRTGVRGAFRLDSHQGQHRQPPPQQGQHNHDRQTTLYQTQPSAALAQHEDVDDDDAASLADLLTEDVEDYPPVDGKEPDSDWDGPDFVNS